MKISDPEVYFYKKIKVLSRETTTVGELYGYDYDYDDDGNEYLEIDVEIENGMIVGFTEDEIESIEVVE